MFLRNIWLALTKQHSKLQHVADSFWESCDFTFFGGAAYYEKRESIMTAVLSEIGRVRSVLDIGCGDGKFTLLIAAYADSVVGYDISPSLVAAARLNAANRGTTHVTFDVAEVENIPKDTPFQMVACIGLLSCILDDAKFFRIQALLHEFVEPGGYLLLIDTLGRSSNLARAYRSGYVARYRRQREYEQSFLDRGFRMERSLVVAEMSQHTVNNLYLLRK